MVQVKIVSQVFLKVADSGYEEAQRRNHPNIGTEHFMLGLLNQPVSIAGRILEDLGINISELREVLEDIISQGGEPSPREVGMTPPARTVFDLAAEERRLQEHSFVCTGHLLLGFVRAEDGVVAGVLNKLGVDLEKVRHEFAHALNEGVDLQNETLPPDPLC